MSAYQTKVSAELSGLLQETPTKFAGTKFHTTSPSPKSLPIPVFTAHPTSTSRLSHAGTSRSSPSELQNQNEFARDPSKRRQSVSSMASSRSRSPAAGTETISTSVLKNSTGSASPVHKKGMLSRLSKKSAPKKIPKTSALAQDFGSARIRLLKRDNTDDSARPSEHTVRSDPVAIPHPLATHPSALISTPPSAEDDHQLDQLSSSLKQLLKIPSLA